MKHFLLLFLLVALSLPAISQNMLERYQKAEIFLPKNVEKITYNLEVHTNWISETNSFWYLSENEKGHEFFLVDAEKGKKKLAFDHQELTNKLNYKLDTVFDANKLPFKWIEFNPDLKFVEFSVKESKWKYTISKNLLEKINKNDIKSTEAFSPDKQWKAIIKDHNIFLENIETSAKKQLTDDGKENYDYATSFSWYYIQNESKSEIEKPEIEVYWSPDSKKLIIPKYNRQNEGKLYMYDSSPDEGWRSDVYSYRRAIAGDSLVTMVEYYLYDLESKQLTKINLESSPAFLISEVKWFKNSDLAYVIRHKRGYQTQEIIEIKPNSETRIVFQENSKTYVDVYFNYEILENEKEFIWISEKSGWSKLYRYNWTNGELINQITKGEYYIKNIEHVDQENEIIYFRANGREEGIDPYFTMLYSVNFDGSNLTLLTPENAYHWFDFSSSGLYFTENYSRVDFPNQFVVRNIKGEIVLKLEEAKVDSINTLGWSSPETFVVKARDGKTDIYGCIYKPTNFDPNKKYPVIDGTYSGPHTIRTPKTFRRAIWNMDNALAELGFVVITVDGFGSAFRSKKFHDFSYRNLGDIGCEDHVTAIKQLAQTRSYIDTNRVGIYGHSAGGYDAVRALILRPDFYKVAVSSAGNHDHRIAKVWWPELYMGYPAAKHYDEQSNIVNAAKIKGKLMLAHGMMDNNVNPAGTLRLSDELVNANKDFEMILIPNADHGQLWFNKYFIRKRWDFFVKNLLEEEPPFEYKIK
jgi:dipeptidyl-peptidase 4